MTTVTLESPLVMRRTSTTYYVTVGGHDYRATHNRWAASKWNDGGETWAVITSHTDRVCDPDKPVAKRVIAAIKQSLAV